MWTSAPSPSLAGIAPAKDPMPFHGTVFTVPGCPPIKGRCRTSDLGARGNADQYRLGAGAIDRRGARGGRSGAGPNRARPGGEPGPGPLKGGGGGGGGDGREAGRRGLYLRVIASRCRGG